MFSNKTIKIKSCKLNLSKEVLGKKIIIDNNSDYYIDNKILTDIIKLEKIKFDFFTNKYEKLISTLNCDELTSFKNVVFEKTVGKLCVDKLRWRVDGDNDLLDVEV